MKRKKHKSLEIAGEENKWKTKVYAENRPVRFSFTLNCQTGIDNIKYVYFNGFWLTVSRWVSSKHLKKWFNDAVDWLLQSRLPFTRENCMLSSKKTA